MSELAHKNMRLWPWLLWGALFALLMIRNCAFGAVYWPQLDDYIQYVNYPSSSSLWDLHQSVGLLASRPLAGAADYFLWGRLFDHMILGVAIISALYAASTVLFQRLVARYFPCGPVFLVVMALLPLGVEGTYWMSASTRVVCGMFFAAIAAWAFARWLDRRSWGWALVYLLLLPLPFGFYEQAGLLGVAFTMGMAILERFLQKKVNFRGLLSLWGIPAMGLYLAAMRLLSLGGVYADRAQIVLPTPDHFFYYWTNLFPQVSVQMVGAFLLGGLLTLGKGFIRGVQMIFSGELLLWVLFLLVLCLLFYKLSAVWKPNGETPNQVWPAVVSGLLLMAAPVSLFFVLDNPWFSLRGTVTSFVGAALLVDTLAAVLWRRLAPGGREAAVLAAGLAFIFCVAGASDIRDYRDTYQDDQKIAALAMEVLAKDYPTAQDAQGKRVGLLGVEPSFLTDQNFFWHEHIHGCTESGWAFSGLLTSLKSGRVLPEVVPLPSDPLYRGWNREVNRPDGFHALYYYNGTEMEPVHLVETGEMSFDVLRQDGSEVGVIWEENGEGHFRTTTS